MKLKVVGRIMDYLREESTSQVGLLVMLLANVTTNEGACLDLLQLDNSALAGLNVYASETSRSFACKAQHSTNCFSKAALQGCCIII